MSITGIPLSGLRAGMTRLTASVSNIANAQSTDYRPVRAVQGEIAGGEVAARIEASGAAEVDLTDEMVGMLIAKLDFQANAKMLETLHNLDRRMLETLG